MNKSLVVKGLLFGFLCTTTFVLKTVAQEKPFLKTSDGLRYILHKVVKNAQKPVTGDVVELRMMYKTSTDSIIYDNRNIDNAFVHILEKPAYKADFNEAIALLGIGDSATFLLRADSFYVKTLREKVLPKSIKKGSDLTFYVKLLSITPNAEYMKKQMDYMEEVKAKSDKFRKVEEDSLKKYLEINKINTPPTSSGLIFISEREGNGIAAEDGKKAVVHYKGYLLNGKQFDSSIERGAPFEFKVGSHAVIRGFEEAVKRMKTGGKAKVIIPSKLAYNDNEVGDIPAYSTLIFELELIEVK